jgi:hypothetical protein
MVTLYFLTYALPSHALLPAPCYFLPPMSKYLPQHCHQAQPVYILHLVHNVLCAYCRHWQTVQDGMTKVWPLSSVQRSPLSVHVVNRLVAVESEKWHCLA